jgi:hypothetical protein
MARLRSHANALDSAAARVQAGEGDTHDGALVAADGVWAQLLFDLAKWAHGFTAEILGEIEDVLQTAGDQFQDEIGSDAAWKMPEPRAVKNIRSTIFFSNTIGFAPAGCGAGIPDLTLYSLVQPRRNFSAGQNITQSRAA